MGSHFGSEVPPPSIVETESYLKRAFGKLGAHGISHILSDILMYAFDFPRGPENDFGIFLHKTWKPKRLSSAYHALRFESDNIVKLIGFGKATMVAPGVTMPTLEIGTIQHDCSLVFLEDHSNA